MINYNNHNITGISYNSHSIKYVYGCGGNLVWSDTPTPTNYKLKIHTSDSGGKEYWSEIPCDGSNHLTLAECYNLLNEVSGKIVIDVYVGECVEILESDCFFGYSSSVGSGVNGWTLYLPSTLKQWRDAGASSDDGLKELKNILPTIPSAITSLPLSTRNKKFTSYVLPNTVISIGDFFAGSPLTSFTMSESQIETGVFDGCTSLPSIVIPSSVTTINDNAFNNCSSLKSLTFNGNNVISIGTNAFNLAFSPSGWNRAITLPNSVETIGANAFNESKILYITIGTNITSIGNKAFAWSTLEEMTILATTPPTLGSGSFNRTNITSIYVPDESVNAYKTTSGWSDYASIIKPISEKP